MQEKKRRNEVSQQTAAALGVENQWFGYYVLFQLLDGTSQNKEEMLRQWTTALESLQYSCVYFKARRKKKRQGSSILSSCIMQAKKNSIPSFLLSSLGSTDHVYCYCLLVCYNAFLEHLRLFPHLTKKSISSLFPGFSKAVARMDMISIVINTCLDSNVNNLKKNIVTSYSFLSNILYFTRLIPIKQDRIMLVADWWLENSLLQ